MFTWICEKCGRECQPTESECSQCHPKADAAPPPAPGGPVTPPTFGVTAKTAVEIPAAPARKPEPVREEPPAPKPRNGLPGWAAALLSFIAIAVVGGGAYFGLRYWQNRPAGEAAPAALTPAVVATRNPLLKQIEVTGLRITEDERKKVLLTFAIVNHAPSAIDNVRGTVTVRTKEGVIGKVEFAVPTISANSIVDVTQPLSTSMRVYELPDWQFLTADLELVN